MGLLDIIGPVMIGPSSSHTAGAVRLGNFARLVLGDEPRRAEIGLHGSFAATGHGHGTHLAILSGIMGLAPDDERIPRAKDLAGERGLEYSLASADLGDVHPNSACMMLYGRNPERKADICGSSVGGGEIRIWRLDGFEVDLEGRYPTVVLAHADHPGVVAGISAVLAGRGLNIAGMKVHRTGRGGQALTTVELDQEPGEDVLARLRGLPEVERIRFVPSLV